MTGFQRIEQGVHWTVGKPLSAAIYGLWRGGQFLAASARSGFCWLRGHLASTNRA
jgi:hypothetical protein